MIRLPKVVDDDAASSNDLSYVVVPPDDPASSPASRSHSRSPRRVAVSSGSGDGVHPASPVSMVGSEQGVMSIFSSDTDADLEDELSHLQAPVSPVSVVASVGVMESPSRYLDPAVPSVHSAVSSYVRVSSGQDREVSFAATLDVFPVYEQSPDMSYYVSATSPVTPLSSELPLLDPESLPLRAPASLDRLVTNDITLLDHDADLSLLAVPLLPLPDDRQLLPDIALERRPVSDSHPLPP